jgi:hypothetical protein
MAGVFRNGCWITFVPLAETSTGVGQQGFLVRLVASNITNATGKPTFLVTLKSWFRAMLNCPFIDFPFFHFIA